MKSNKYKEKSNLLGNLIAQNRKVKKMSQNKLASKMQILGVNIGKNDISKIEAGNRLIRDYELIAIKDILDLDLNNIHL
ncbi:MAG: helix-turn-helix transcriptional regulator [Clostridia bacterium]|nr:helix-turn-helix transcriptional regulator [Clostridia bacterium]MCI9413207.1 helix-turn-helix transcriptional regulator [Clostridia bacterium]